jgi:hypothetical protein
MDAKLPDRLKVEAFYGDPDHTINALGIRNKINKWIENCRNWFFKSLLTKVINDNVNNINNLDKVLTLHFGRKLNERELISGMGYLPRDPKGDESLTFTTIDDIISYEGSTEKNGYFWPVRSKVSREETDKIHEELNRCIKERLRLERYFRIKNYSPWGCRYFY